MAIKDIQTNKYDLQEYLLLIAKVPEKVNKIDIDIKKELLIDIDNRISSMSKTITGLIANTPNYNYPDNYLPDKLFEYWASNYSQLFNINELKSLKLWIKNSIEQSKVNTGTKDLEVKDYKTENWFKIGLLFATGEMDLLLKEYGNGTQIAKKLGNTSYRPFITESISSVNKFKSVQSIYNQKKFPLIYKHCIENDIKMSDSFENFCIKNLPDLTKL